MRPAWNAVPYGVAAFLATQAAAEDHFTAALRTVDSVRVAILDLVGDGCLPRPQSAARVIEQSLREAGIVVRKDGDLRVVATVHGGNSEREEECRIAFSIVAELEAEVRFDRADEPASVPIPVWQTFGAFDASREESQEAVADALRIAGRDLAWLVQQANRPVAEATER